jgi:hypothetical protein
MRIDIKVLSFVVTFCVVTTAFKTSISRCQLKSIHTPIYAATNQEREGRRNIFQEMIQAFVDAFPAMLQPQKEMDKKKVNTFDKTPKWVKVSLSD